MQAAYSQFLINVKATKEFEALWIHLTQVLKLPNDLSDLLRLKIVYGVSALDTLVHELTRIGMLQCYAGRRPVTSSFSNFRIKTDTLLHVQNASIATTPPEYYFEQEIRVQHSYIAFQEPNKITEALGLFWLEPHKWTKIANVLMRNEEDVKNQLKLICSRRNQIVHEFDLDPVSKTRRPIYLNDAKDSLDFIEKLGETIFNLVK